MEGGRNSSVEPANAYVQEPPAATDDSPPGVATLRHFVLQGQRPSQLGDIALTEMDPSLRGLLFTDGTVTRTLEVQTLSRVSLDVVGQTRSTATGRIASYLQAPSGIEAIRRRVVIGVGGSAAPVIWAESHILPCRLPRDFLDVLSDSSDGIGESLQQVKLESWRDMLWFGLDSPPRWSCVDPQSAPQVITRLYRVITGNRPALLISESIAVTQRDGTYHLDWLR